MSGTNSSVPARRAAMSRAMSSRRSCSAAWTAARSCSKPCNRSANTGGGDMDVMRTLLVDVLSLLRDQERYHKAQDVIAALRDQRTYVAQSPLTAETQRLREELEERLADAPPG